MKNATLLAVILALLACKQSNDRSSDASPASSSPETPVVAGIGFGGSLTNAENDAKARAAKGEETLLGGQLSGVKELCVAVAWKVPTKNRRALFVTVSGPTSMMRSQRVEPGPTAGLCIENVTPGRYTLNVSHGPSVAGAPSDRLPEFGVTIN